MATSPSTTSFFSAPYAFPTPIPNQIDQISGGYDGAPPTFPFTAPYYLSPPPAYPLPPPFPGGNCCSSPPPVYPPPPPFPYGHYYPPPPPFPYDSYYPPCEPNWPPPAPDRDTTRANQPPPRYASSTPSNLSAPSPGADLPPSKLAFHTSTSTMQSLAPVITHPDCNVFHDDDGHKTDAAQRRAPDVFLDRRPSSSRATPTAPPRERLQHHSEADAVQRRATALLLDRRPSLSPTAARDSTVELGGPSLDCSHTKLSYCRPTVPNREGCTSPNSASSKVAFVTSASRMKPDRAPVLTAHARLLLPQDGELDAVQCCTTTALGRPIFDCLPAVCGSAAEVTLEEATARVICDSSASSTTTTGQAPSAGFTTPSGSINKVASAPSMFYNSNAAASYVSSRTGPSIVVHTPVLASVYATSEATNACTVPSVTSYCALKVFGKRPAKSYLQETDDTAPGQHNSIQKLRVSTNSWEQNLDEKPPVFDVYSDEKEECSSMFFDEPGSDTHGDGNASKNQQYLPVFDVYDDATEDSSNSCVHVSASTLEPLFSSEFVGVWTGTPKQQQFEEEQQYRHHILKNYSKPISSPARTTLGAVNLFSLDTAELIGESVKQNDSDTQILAKQLKASPGNMLMSGMIRNLWDPGVSAFLVTPLNTGSSNDTSGVSPATPLDKHGITDSSNQQLHKEKQPETEHSNACLNISSDVRDFTLEVQHQNDEKASIHVSQLRASQLNTVRQSISDQVDSLNPSYLTTPWDPGVSVIHAGTTRSSTRTTSKAEWVNFTSSVSCKCSGQAHGCVMKPIVSLAKHTVGI